VVEDESHIGLVDAHPERNRRHDNLQRVTHPLPENCGFVVGGDVAVVRARADSLAPQSFGNLVCVFFAARCVSLV